MPPNGDDPRTLGATIAANPLEAFLAIGTSAEDACHAVLEVLGEGLVITDPGGVIRHATARFASFAGATPAALCGRDLLDLLDQSYGRDVTEALGHRTGSVLNLDRVRFRRLDGAARVADVTLTAFRGRDRTFAGWLVLVRDRTEDVRREDLQRRQDELLRIIADGVPAAIAYIDRDERHVYANQAFLEWGYSPADPLGMTVRELVGDEVYAEIQPRIQAAFAGETVRYEARRTFGDRGRPRFIQATYRPHRDERGRVEGIFVLLHDVSELKAAEEAAKKNEQQLRLIADNLPLLIAYVDRDERYRFVNQYYRTLGLPVGTMVGQRVQDVIAPGHYEVARLHIQKALAGEAQHFQMTWPYYGHERYVDITYLPHVDERGDVPGCFVMAVDITERKQAQDALAASEERYRALAEAAPDMIFVIDRDLVVRYVNPSARAAFGGADQVGRPMSHLFPVAEAERQGRSLRAVFETGEPFSREGPSTFGGRQYWLHTHLAPMRDAAGDVIAVLGVSRDMTERRQVELALADSELRFRSLFEAAPFGVAFTDYATERIERANAAFASMLGYEPDELVGRSVVELTHPDDRGDQVETQATVRAGRVDQYAMEKRYLCKDGSHVWARLKAFLLKDETGRVLHAVGMTEDITEQVRLVDELRQSKERFEKLIATLPIGVGIVRDETAVFVNPALCRILGYRADELVGRSLDGLIDDVEGSPLERLFEQFDQGKLDVISGIVKAHRGDGVTIDLEIVASAIEQPEGRGVIYLCSDVTREQELEQQLIRAQKMQAIGTLAGGIAHDFNNLLTGIGGHAGFVRSLLEQHALPTDDADGILRLQRRGANLTEKLLALGRRQMIRMVPVDLNRLTRDFAGLARRVIGERIELVTDLADDVPPVMADPLQFEQVLLNLTVNARDAMDRGGTLTLATRRGPTLGHEAPTAIVSVSDTGHGIDPAIVDRIFEPFFTTKEFGKGTGLGLAVAYGIVEQHRGTIRPISRETGGAEFRIELPSTLSVPAPAASKAVPAFVDSGGTETILVAEDDENLRDLARRVLERKGYRVLLASDGEQAVKLFDRERSRISLLLFDVAMPRKGGIEALSEIRALASDLPAILVSGYSERLTEQTSRDLGSPAFLRKPFSNDQLVHEVRTALDRGSSNDRSREPR